MGLSVSSFNSASFPTLTSGSVLPLHNMGCSVSSLWTKFHSYQHPIAKQTPRNLSFVLKLLHVKVPISLFISGLSALLIQKLQWFKVYFMLTLQSSVCCQEKGFYLHNHSGHGFLWVAPPFPMTSEAQLDSLNLANKRDRKISSIAYVAFEVDLEKMYLPFACILWSGTQWPIHTDWKRGLWIQTGYVTRRWKCILG